MKEYAIWGVPPNEENETLLLSRIFSERIPQAKIAFCKKQGCTKIRVQTIDLSQPYEGFK